MVAKRRRAWSSPVITSSIGFDEKEFDELPYARSVASRFATTHYEQVVRPDALAILEKRAWHYDEPFGDPSAVPTFQLCREARRHLKVALSVGVQRMVRSDLGGAELRVEELAPRTLERDTGHSGGV